MCNVTTIFSRVRRLVAIRCSAKFIPSFYELEGRGRNGIKYRLQSLFSARYQLRSVLTNSPINQIIFLPFSRTHCIRKHEDFYHSHGTRPLCGCHPGRSHCSWGSRSPSRISLRPPCSMHTLRRYWCRVYAIRPAGRTPTLHGYVPSLFDTETSSQYQLDLKTQLPISL